MAQTQYKSIDLKGYLDLNKNELRNARLQNLGADIGSPVDGLILYRTDTFKIRARINGAWQDLATMADVTAGGISSSLVDVKGDLIVATADNTVARKAAGANGTYLQAQSGQSDGLLWTTIADADLPSTITRDTEVFLLSSYTTKGDIAAATGSGAASRLGAGSDGAFLVAASGQATGLQWRVIATADIQEKIATADLTDWPRVAALDLNSQKITGMADGTATTDGATFGQLNAILEGKSWKQFPAQAATTGALPNTPTYSSGAGTLTAGSNTTLAAQDGITLAVGDTLLVKNQASSFQNGIYTLTAAGSGAAPWVLTRRADGNVFGELQSSATIYVAGGTTQGGDIYTQTATLTNLTSDTQTWTKTGDTNTVYTADGTTITLTGTQFSVTTGGILNAQVGAGAAIAYSKLNLGTSIVNADIAAGAAIVYSKLALTNSIVNADVAAGAAIAYSKLALGTSIVNSDISASAAIAYSKLNLTGAILNADLAGSIAYSKLSLTGAILNADLAGSIAYSKLSLTGAILNADLAGSIAYSKLSLSGAILATDIATAAGIPYSKLDQTLTRKFAVAITGGATTEVITHNLNTRYIYSVALINPSTPWDANDVEWAATSVNTITLSSPVNLPATYRCVVTG